MQRDPAAAAVARRTAVRRLTTEYREMMHNAPEGILAAPVDEEKSMFEWEATLAGPPDSMCVAAR